MKLNLTRPLVVFDLETTGLDIVRDRIFQLSYIKVYPDGKEERENIFVNPGKEIPQEVVELTGTSNADVADKPTFKALAPELAEKFANCDFAGFNSNHFDLPMLAEEFYRAGINYDFSQCRLIDAQTIFHKMERRNLAAAYKFYCGRKMEDDFDAHRADQDTEATYRVLMGELDMYAPGKQEEEERQLENDMDVLAQFSKQNDNVDFAGRVVWKEMKDANGQEEEAETDYKFVTEINPFNEQAYLYLGQLYINQKKLAEAIALFDEAIELNPNFAEAYKERGRAKLLNGDKDGSVEDMKKSLELNPKDEASLNGEFKNLGPKPEALPGIF